MNEKKSQKSFYISQFIWNVRRNHLLGTDYDPESADETLSYPARSWVLEYVSIHDEGVNSTHRYFGIYLGKSSEFTPGNLKSQY